MNSQIALEKKVEINRDLLIAALNKNQVSFAQIAKSAESISSGSLKLKLDSGGKVFVFEYLNKKVVLEMNTLRLKGLKYLNDILIDDILTKGELDEVYRILEQVQEELLNKADKEHTHEISDVNGLQDELDSKMNIGSSEFNDIIVNDKIEIPNQQKPDSFPYITDVKITGSLTTTTIDADKRGITISFLEAKLDTYVGEEKTIFLVRDDNSTFQIDIDCGTYDPNKSYPVKGTNVPSNITYPSTFVNNNFSLHIDFTAEESKEAKKYYILGRYLGLGGAAYASSHNYITISFDYDIEAASLINNEVPTKKFIVDWLYPIGSIYISMNKVDPSKIFGGTWTPIYERFLLCSNGDSQTTGGSKTITKDNLPVHNHSLNLATNSGGEHTHRYCVSDDRNGYPDGSADTSLGTSTKESYWRGNKNLNQNAFTSVSTSHSHTISGNTNNAGSGKDYWQPFIRCYGWYRTA